MSQNEIISWSQDDDGVVVLTVDDDTQKTNTLNRQFQESLRATVDRLKAAEGITGVIMTSGKSTFFAGGDLHELSVLGKEDSERLFAEAMSFKATLRDLETLGVPVVAALNGTALGGGLEIALACHRRVALRRDGVLFGLPEVTLGLLPGGGGVVRSVRLLGLEAALDRLLLRGQTMSTDDALLHGVVDAVVDTREELMAQAKGWIAANPEASQPWEASVSNGVPIDDGLLPVLTARLRKRSKGGPVQAAHHILCAAVEGAGVGFEAAMKIESRYFVNLVTGQVAKNLIRARFTDPQAVRAGRSRPAGFEVRKAQQVAVLGAGMMGVGIAYQCALNGLEVVLKDVTPETARAGVDAARAILDRAVGAGSVSAERALEISARLRHAETMEDCSGADIVVEAVFESEELKLQILAEIEAVVGPDVLIGSNTSTIPITDLARALQRPERIVGLHFFSPVERMPLLEVIRGGTSTEETMARAFDFGLQIKKTPIVVNDNRGFFTSRVIGTVVNEGVAMLGEGLDPVFVERAATAAGYPVGMLQLTDELNMELSVKVFAEARLAREALGEVHVPHPAELVIQRMVELGRPGRLRRAGFYEYDDDGRRIGLWPGTFTEFSHDVAEIPWIDAQERMLFIEALESVRCLEEGILRSAVDGNVGSTLGIGYPAWTGGVLEFINQYRGGPAGFRDRARELEIAYGSRFAPPRLLDELAGSGALLR